MARRRGGDDSSRDELSRLLLVLRGDRTQTEAAELVGLTQSKVTRAERNRFPMSVDEVRAYAAALTDDEQLVARAVELAEAKASGHLRGRVVLVRVAAAIQERIDVLEREAQLVRGWHPATILGSLQTTAYTTALLEGDGGGDPGPAWWAARRRRTDKVLEPGRQWRLLISEAALRWPVGSRAVMREQLAHLTTMAALPNVTLGVLDFATPKAFTSPNPFHLYDERTATAATDVGTSFLTDPEDIGHYVALFEQLDAVALHGAAAVELLERVARSYRR